VLAGAGELVSLQDQDPRVSFVYDPKPLPAAGFLQALDPQRSRPQPVFQEREVVLLGRTPA
jgi:hypothetical protein